MADKRPRKTRSKTRNRKHPNKVRVKLPGIESYEKELEFTAEGPGRVVVRLERLMGSDRIRITDPKYLATLVERLEAEETRAWVSRSRLRKKAEKNRSRQLAIDGLMEPTEDMQDLYNHPVFRVNRVLNRLNLFDYNMSHPGATGKLPPIQPVEPFCEDDTGAVFKKYNGHHVVMVEALPDWEESHMSFSNTDMLLGRTKTDIILEAKMQAKEGSPGASKSKIDLDKDKSEEDEDEDKEEEDEEGEGGSEEEDDEEGEDDDEMKLEELPGQLGNLQKLYGVPSDEDLVRNWQPFRSNLVDLVYEEPGDHKEMYDVGQDVEGVYARQYETVKEYVEPLEEQVQIRMANQDNPVVDDTNTSESTEQISKSASKAKGATTTASAASKISKLGKGQSDDEEEGDESEEYQEEDNEFEEELEEGSVKPAASENQAESEPTAGDEE